MTRTPPALFTSILLLAMAIGCAQKQASLAPVAVSPLTMSEKEWRITDQVFVVTDASGTMYEHQTFPTAKALTQSIIAGMPETSARAQRPSKYAAGAVGFGGADRKAVPLSDFDRGSLANNASGMEIMGDISGTGGTTPLHDVFVEVQRQVRPSGGPVGVIVVSDGIPDEPALANWAAYRIKAGHGDKVCFHTVQTGDDPAGAAFLQQIANLSTCGTFRRAADLANPGAVTNFERIVFAGELPPVAASPCHGVVRLRGIEFEFDRAELKASSEQVLDVTVTHLKECPDVAIQVEGHTDGIGSESYNQGLSERRAKSTRDYFVSHGIDAGRLSSSGYGESRPLDSNDTDDGRARNRRVELRPAQ